jgi:hypothetical protein
MARRERDLMLRVLGFRIALILFGLPLMNAKAAAFFHADFEQRYFAHPELLITDHSLIRDNQGTYHLFYTVGIVEQGWPFPNNMVDFGHATSGDLIHWTDQPRLLTTITGTWKDRNLWAPQAVSLPQGGHALYYCGVDSFMVQATGVAYAPDLVNWTDLNISAPAYHPDSSWAVWQPEHWSNGRDPFAFRLGNGIGLLTTATASDEYTGVGDRGAISLASSTDGVHFVDAGFPMFVNDSNRTLESTSLHRRPDRYFLFFVESGYSGVRYMTSPMLLSGWDKTQTQILDPVAFAPSEVISTGNGTILGRNYDADFNGTILYGAKFDTLAWGFNSVSFRSINTLWDRWTVVSGDAFTFQPVYGDRALVRGSLASGHEDFFWINTAETYTGPIFHNDPNTPPEVERTGVLRSRPFTITGGHMRFLIGGGEDFANLYLALIDAANETTIHRTTGPGSNVLDEQFWDLAGLVGVTCFVEIVDNRSSGDDGYIAIDGIREGEGPPPVNGVEWVPAPEQAMSLGAAYPSPTRGATSIPFRIQQASRVRLMIYDVAGRLRRLVLDRDLAAGAHSTRWDGRDADGARVPAGIYFLRLESGSGAASRPLSVVR